MQTKIFHLLSLIRFDKPIGTLLLFWPCMFGVAISYEEPKQLNILWLFLLGSFVMRSAGCIINDIWDREFDKNVERTKARPLASGALQLYEAIILLAILLSVGFWVLLQLPFAAIKIGVIIMAGVIIYPLMKRITYLPQIFLGIVMNIGVLIAYVTLAGEIELQAIIFYICCVFWTFGYDSIYGFMDLKDDLSIGVKSSAMILPKQYAKLIIWASMMMLNLAFLIELTLYTYHPISYLFLSLSSIWTSWVIYKTNLNNKPNCLHTFKIQGLIGGLIAIGLVLGRIL